MSRFEFDPVPTLSPTGAPSGDYENITASPAAFGGQKARALQTLGQGVENVGEAGFNVLKFHNKIASDYEQTNTFQDVDKMLYGDPSKSTPGADGKPVPDLGFMGLTGRDAADRREDTIKAIEERRQQGRNNLSSPEAQLEYDNSTKRYVQNAYNQIGRHSESQFKSWTADSNEVNANQARNDFVRNLDNPDMRNWAATRYISFREQQAQAKYGNDPEILAGVKEDAKRDLLKAHTDAVAVNDAPGAMEILKQNKDLAGSHYDDMYRGLEARANKQLGDRAGASAIDKAKGGTFAPTTNSSIQNVATRYGISPDDLSRAVKIESGGNPRAQTGSYKGLLQLSQGEFDKYKTRPDASIWNPQDNLEAGAAKMRAEGAQFAKNFGREPTGFDSYMIHQQGLAGYSAHLANPNAPAWQNMLSTGEGRQRGERWARDAIWGNIPNQYKATFGNVDNVTSRDFIAMWGQKYGGPGGAVVGGPQFETTHGVNVGSPIGGGGPPAIMPTVFDETPLWQAPGLQPVSENRGAFESASFPVPNVAASIKPNAYQHVLDDPELRNNPEARARALQVVSQQLQAEEIAENQTAKAKSQNKDLAASAYVSAISAAKHGSGTDLVALAGKINADPNLAAEPHLKQWLLDLVTKGSREEQEIGFGPGYRKAFDGILTSKTTYADLISRDDITTAGLEDIRKRVSLAKGDVDRHAIEMKIQSFLHGAKRDLSFEQIDGPVKIMDPKGEQIYNYQFVPEFVSRASALADEAQKTGDHSKLDKFLSAENVKKMVRDYRNPQDMAADRMRVTGETVGTPEAAGAPLPPAPEGVNEDGWKTAVKTPPMLANGHAATHQQWAEALTLLASNPSPQVMAQFDRYFAPAGIKAADVLGKLNPAAATAARMTGHVGTEAPAWPGEEKAEEAAPAAAPAPAAPAAPAPAAAPTAPKTEAELHPEAPDPRAQRRADRTTEQAKVEEGQRKEREKWDRRRRRRSWRHGGRPHRGDLPGRPRARSECGGGCPGGQADRAIGHRAGTGARRPLDRPADGFRSVHGI
jgi:hypothetical protein